MLAPHRIVKIVAALFCVAVFAAIVIWEVLRVTAAPLLIVSTPSDNLLTASHRVVMEGRTEPGSTVTINGARVSTSLDGSFKEALDLRTGANVITIVASKKFAKPNTIYRRVVVTN